MLQQVQPLLELHIRCTLKSAQFAFPSGIAGLRSTLGRLTIVTKLKLDHAASEERSILNICSQACMASRFAPEQGKDEPLSFV